MTLILFVIGFLVICFGLYFLAIRQISSVSDGVVHSFEDLRFSTKEFYQIIESLIQSKEVPDLKCLRVYHSMRGILSAKREYLRVQYQEYFFDVCAAPFGRDFFLSWRQGTLTEVKINKRDMKTFYEQDTQAMFSATVKYCIDKAMKQVADSRGMRTVEGKEIELYN